MNYRDSRSLFGLRILRQALSFFLLIFPSAELIHAQPGTPDNAPDMEGYLQPAFAELARQIKKEPTNPALYVRRSNLYMQIYVVASRGPQRVSYMEKALAELSAAIEVKPTAEAYNARTRCHHSAWYDMYPPPEDVKAIVDFFVNDRYIEEMKSDLLNSIRLDQSNENLASAFGWLSRLYLERAENLSKPAVMRELRAQGGGFSVWDVFDTAIEYARKATRHGSYRADVADLYAAKGRAANELGEYDSALETFANGEEYARDDVTCRYYSAWGEAYMGKQMFAQARKTFTKGILSSEVNCRFLLERRADAFVMEGKLQNALLDYTALWDKSDCCKDGLSIKRAKIYLKLNEPEKALADLDYAIEHYGICPQGYLLRAETYKLLGEFKKASKDEQQAYIFRSRSDCTVY